MKKGIIGTLVIVMFMAALSGIAQASGNIPGMENYDGSFWSRVRNQPGTPTFTFGCDIAKREGSLLYLKSQNTRKEYQIRVDWYSEGKEVSPEEREVLLDRAEKVGKVRLVLYRFNLAPWEPGMIGSVIVGDKELSCHDIKEEEE